MNTSNFKKERLIAFAIDYALLAVFQGILSPIIILTTDKLNVVDAVLILTLITSAIMFGKDTIKGQSLGKRIMRLAVVKANNETVCPNPFQLITRNITLVFWPIEAILFFNSKDGRRLGDKITKTEVKRTI